MAAWALVTLLPVYAVSNLTWVAVGAPGNPPDPVTKAGQVGYAFEIMATEVPNWLYCDFLNAVAGHEDPHGLYTPLLADHFFGGIVRTQSDAFSDSCPPAQAQARGKPNAANYYGRSWAAPFPHLTPVGPIPARALSTRVREPVESGRPYDVCVQHSYAVFFPNGPRGSLC